MGNKLSIPVNNELMMFPQTISYQPMPTSDSNEILTFSPFISRPYRESNIVTISDSENED